MSKKIWIPIVLINLVIVFGLGYMLTVKNAPTQAQASVVVHIDKAKIDYKPEAVYVQPPPDCSLMAYSGAMPTIAELTLCGGIE